MTLWLFDSKETLARFVVKQFAGRVWDTPNNRCMSEKSLYIGFQQISTNGLNVLVSSRLYFGHMHMFHLSRDTIFFKLRFLMDVKDYWQEQTDKICVVCIPLHVNWGTHDIHSLSFDKVHVCIFLIYNLCYKYPEIFT